MIDKISAQRKKLDNVKRKWKQLGLVLMLLICLALSCVSIATCKFADIKLKHKLLPSITYSYGVWGYHGTESIGNLSIDTITDGNDPYDYKNRCYSYQDKSATSHSMRKNTTIRSAAQGTGIFAMIMVIVALGMASRLRCHDFSSCYIHLIQFVLVLALASSIALLVLVQRQGFNKVFDDYDRLGFDLEFSIDQGKSASATASLIILTLIFTFLCKCSKEPETEGDNTVKVEVVVKVEAPVHVPDEEAEIHVPQEGEPQVYVGNVNAM